MVGSSVFDTFSHLLQLLTTFENFWEWWESGVYLYGGKWWEVRSLLQGKTIPSTALGSYSSTRPHHQSSGPWWCPSATTWASLATDPSRGWPTTPPSSKSVGLWDLLCASLICLLSCCPLWHSEQVRQRMQGSISQLCSAIHSRDMGTYTGVGSSEQQKGCFFPGLRRRLGDEQFPVQSWSSSHDHHYCILWQDPFPVSVRQNYSFAIFPLASQKWQNTSLFHRPLGLFSATDLYWL